MKHKLRYSPEAIRDLDEINEYITDELSNPDAAYALIDRILDAAERLEAFPESGAPVASVASIPNDYRFIPIEQYIIFYRVQSPHVSIDRILYGRRDYLRILFDPQR